MMSMFDYIRKNKLLLLLIFIAFIFFMITMWPSGNHYCYKEKCGLFYWGSNEHDGVWHLALSETAFKHIPFVLPIFSGTKLMGYNYLMDLIMHLLRFFRIPASFLYFQFFPFLWFIMFTYLLIRLARNIKDSPIFVGWLLFFSYFGASFSYFFTLYHQKTIWGSSSLIAMQSGNMLTNMPFALSLLVLLTILIIMRERKLTLRMSFLLGILISMNTGLKLYSGLISLILVYIYYFRKKDTFLLLFNYAIIFALFWITILIFYNPSTSLKSGSIFIFSPFATMHAMIEEPIYFYLKNLTNARYYLYEHGGLLSPRLWGIELFSTGLFLFFSLGLRIFGTFYFIVKFIQKKLSVFDRAIFISAFFALTFLILFIQKGQWWNVIQFYYYSLFLMNIFTALFFYEVLKRIKNKITVYGVTLFIIILTLPPNIDILKTFTAFPAPAYVSDEELKALAFLKKQPEGVVFAPLYENKIFQDPQPLGLKKSTSYIPAFSGKQVYYADEIQLSLFGIKFESRRDRMTKGDCSILAEIDYVYLIKNGKSLFIDKCVRIPEFPGDSIFENREVLILKMK